MSGPGWRAGLAALALYVAALVVATWPTARSMTEALPSRSDPMMHLWVMKWYRSCLLEGRSPVACPDLQYPVGAALGLFSPMLLQGLLFLPLSLATGNDVLAYNLLWFGGFLFTGMGTFALAWSLLRSRAGATLAGLLAMLSTPMMIHGVGHLELVYLGGFPLFLLAWMRLLDAPSGRRLAAAAGLYLLMTLGAAYFAVLGAVPAGLYVVWSGARAVQGGDRVWLRSRAGWLAGFVALALPPLALAFGNQIWAATHGHAMGRSWREFTMYGSPLWSYATPTAFHALAGALPCNVHEQAGMRETVIERGSYLGLVTLALVWYAATRRARFAGAGFVWAAFGLVVVLSIGPTVVIGPATLDLPAAWLWRAVPAFRLIRMVGRFNLTAAVLGAVLAGAGLAHGLGRLRSKAARAVVFVGVVGLAVADLAMVPYPGQRFVPPAPPPIYRELAAIDPRAGILEAPLDNSSSAHPVVALGGYWQATHRAATTAGYSGVANARFDNRLVYLSPFSAARMADPSYLRDGGPMRFDLVAGVRFEDYAWLYLRSLGLRYVALHRDGRLLPGLPALTERVAERLRPARIYDDGTTAVFDRDRLPAPTRPVLACGAGWTRRYDLAGPEHWVMGRAGDLAIFNPSSDLDLIVSFEARALNRPRVVRLLSGGSELSRWTVAPDRKGRYASPPIRLASGLGTLRLEADGVERPRSHREAIDGTMTPFSLRVSELSIERAAERLARSR